MKKNIKLKIICYSFILFGFLLFFSNIYYCTPSALKKIQKKIQCIQQGKTGTNTKEDIDNKYFDKIKEITIQELFNPYIPIETTGTSRELQKKGFWWPTALLADSLETCHRSLGIKADFITLIKFYNKYIDINGDFKESNILEYLGNIMHGNTLIYLEQITKDKKYLKAIEQMYTFLTNYNTQTTSNVIPYRKNFPKLFLVDSLGMICPFLARYGKIYNKPEATKLAELQVIDFINNGVDPITGLPYHGYIAGRKGYIGILGWGRGTGWYLYGLVGTLEYFPLENYHKEQMISALRKIVETLKIYQKENGAWAWSITNLYENDEMSGTAMIAYSIEKAIRLNLLSQNYYKMLDNAHNILISNTTDKGFLMGASGECTATGRYSSTYGHSLWVQGPATAFNALWFNRIACKF